MGSSRQRRGKNRNGKVRSGNAATDDATSASGGDSAMMAAATDGAEAVEAETMPPQATPPGSPTKTPQQQQISSPCLRSWVEQKKNATGGLTLPILSVPSPARARGMHSSCETGSVMATSPATSGATAPVAATDSWPLPNCEALNIPVTPQSAPHNHPGCGYREHLRAKGAHAMKQTERWRFFSTDPPSAGASNVMPPLTHCGPFGVANTAAPLPPPPSSPPCSMMELASMQPPPPPTPPPLPTTPHAARHHGIHHQLLQHGVVQTANSVAPLAHPPPVQLSQFDGWPMDTLQSQSPVEVTQQPLPGIVPQPGIDSVQRHDEFFACTSMGGLANVPAAEHIQVVDKSPEQAMMDAIGEIGGLSAYQLAAKLSAASQCRYDD